MICNNRLLNFSMKTENLIFVFRVTLKITVKLFLIGYMCF
jgi:hypothetical protein